MDNNNSTTKSNLEATAIMAIGESIVCLITVLVYLIIGKFDYSVLLGALLGGAVMVANMLFLSLSVNNAVHKYLELRGTKELSDEEAAEFNQKHGMIVQNAMSLSYVIRTLSLIGALVIAFAITNVFSPLPTAIALLAYRPILYVSEVVRTRSKSKEGK